MVLTEKHNMITREEVVTLITNEGLMKIYFFEHSGKVLTRGKIDTITDVSHPGIIMGVDVYNRVWVLHNHYSFDKPVFEVLENYSKAQTTYWDNIETKFTQKEIVIRAVAEQALGKTYNAVTYNCQTFVSIIVQGKPSSPAVDKLADGAMILGTVLGAAGLIFKNKALTHSGLAIIGLSGATKFFSK